VGDLAVGAVTISASYGAGGSLIAPLLAKRLGLPLIDRAISVSLGGKLAEPLAQAVQDEEHMESRLGRIFSRGVCLLSQGTYFAVPLREEEPEEDELRHQAEEGIRRVASTTGAVILGRAAAFVLGDRPDVLNVRLDGPVQRRWKLAAEYERIELHQAQKRQNDADTARSLYVRHFFNARWDDPAAYHLLIDSTAFSIPVCIDLIAAAAASRLQPEETGGNP
jgi:cytidylate kinase